MSALPNSWNDAFGLIRQLSDEDVALASEVTDRLRLKDGWADFVSLPYLLGCWPRIVESTVGYGGTIEEYWNDLDARNLLQDVIDELPAKTANQLEEILEPWDEVFRKRTIDSPGLWRRPGGKPGWWNDRAPRRTGRLW